MQLPMDLPVPVRIMVTGSRDWGSENTIRYALNEALAGLPTAWTHEPPVLVHGGNGCRRQGGYVSEPVVQADALADRLWRSWSWPVHIIWPDWDRHGRSAGMIRNGELVKTRPALCLAFIRGGSAGASHAADRAEAAGIAVRRYLAPALTAATQ